MIGPGGLDMFVRLQQQVHIDEGGSELDGWRPDLRFGDDDRRKQFRWIYAPLGLIGSFPRIVRKRA